MAKGKTRKPSTAKPANKNDKVIELLKRDGGASLTDITGATGWLPHSVRAALTGYRKKGYAIEKSKTDGVTRWSIAAGRAQ